ncbi:MAG: hypothetical protein QOJ19_167 [Acidimicrobiia bacterium]|nr:hypothetical protein [Acidimicrobiia bacterium]
MRATPARAHEHSSRDVKLATTADGRRWDRACHASGQPVTPFHTFRWLALAAAMTGTRFMPLVVRFAGEDVGVAPLMIRRRGVVSLANWLPFPYLGPLVPVDLLGASLDALRPRENFSGVIRQQQSFAPETGVDERSLTARGFSVRYDPTYVVDTRPTEEQMWAALEGRCRTKIRKAEREGVLIEEAVDGSTLREVVQAAFDARDLNSGYEGAFPPSPSVLASLHLAIRNVVATVDGHSVGGLVSIATEDRALIWQGGVLPDFRGTHANVLLYWDAIKWAHRIGVGSIDLVGVPDEGIGRFKSQFGASLTEYVVGQRQSAFGRLIEKTRRNALTRS